MKNIICFLVLILITNSSFLANKEFGLLWEPYVPMDNQLFPSYVWANATRNNGDDPEKGMAEAEKKIKGDREGQLGVKFTNLNFKSYDITVEIECGEIMQRTSYNTFSDKSLGEFIVFPEINFDFNVLKKNYEPRPLTVKFSVYVNGKVEDTKTHNIILRSIYDCPFTFIDAKNNIVDLNFMYAAYVNENNPRIADEILPEMRKQGIISGVTGYQSNTKELYRQVFSVWHYFKNKGVVYSSLNSPNQKFTSETGPYVQYQFVRTLDESMNSTQANCVDGTVAMASVLYKMGIEPFIVTTPNHCFLGFLTDKEKGDVDFIETTALGTKFEQSDLDSIPKYIEVYDEALDKTYLESYRSFLLACLMGRRNYGTDKDKFNSYNAVDRLKILIGDEQLSEAVKKLQYQFFAVKKYRIEGLMPIHTK